MNLCKRVVKKVRRDGLLASLKLTLQITSDFIYVERKGFLLYRDLWEPIDDYQPLKKITLKQATISDISKFSNSIVNNSKVAKFVDRLNKGKLAFLGLIDNSVVSYCWVSLSDERETWLGIPIHVEEGATYFYDSYTFLEYRSKGFHSALLRYAFIYLRDHGYQSTLAVVGRENLPALKSYRSVGFREIETIETKKIFSINVRTRKSSSF